MLLDNSKLAILMPARLGDTLFCTPAIHLLKKNRPNTSITIIAASTLSGSVFNNNPAVTLILIREKNHFLRQIQNFDAIISPHYDASTIQALAEHAVPHFSVGPPDARHQSEQATAFMASLLETEIPTEHTSYCLYPSSADQDRVTDILTAHHVLPETLLIGCHLGCHGLAKGKGLFGWRTARHRKAWPLQQFIAFAEGLSQRHPNVRFVLTGSKEEQLLGQAFAKHIPNTINLMDQTSVLETAVLMSRLKLFVVGDTGTLHLACATQVPLLALFGPTSSIRTGPYPSTTYRHMLQHDPIDALTPATVIDAAEQLFAPGLSHFE